MSYRTIIGLEVHVQLLTRTKLFCGCRTQFGLPPNSATCPVCIGMPGALPVMNRTRVSSCRSRRRWPSTARSPPFTKWDRKNYYYPDLPKNYQISQYDLPFSHDGWLEIETDGRPAQDRHHPRPPRRGRRQDAARRARRPEAISLVDLNRTGTPLLEIVSKPDIETRRGGQGVSRRDPPAAARDRRLRLRDAGRQPALRRQHQHPRAASRRHLRRDADRRGQEPQQLPRRRAGPQIRSGAAGKRVPAQSRRGVWHVDRDEAEQLSRLHKSRRSCSARAMARSAAVSKATAGWDERPAAPRFSAARRRRRTIATSPSPTWCRSRSMRRTLDEVRRETRRTAGRPEGAAASAVRPVRLRRRRAVAAGPGVRRVLRGSRSRQCGDAKEACNWTMNDLLSNAQRAQARHPGEPAVAGESRRVDRGDQGDRPEQAARPRSLCRDARAGASRQGSDRKARLQGGRATRANSWRLIRRAIAANPKAVADFKKGKVKAADAIKGAVMRETKGMAKTEVVQAAGHAGVGQGVRLHRFP